jgi:hypothetical protein
MRNLPLQTYRISLSLLKIIIMFGKFQQSHLRLEIEAPAKIVRDFLLHPESYSKWLWYQRFSSPMPEKLYSGFTFTSWTGLIEVRHQVQVASDNCLRLLLSQGIDGYHEWYWGEGWVQSRLEGISLLPLNLGQTLTLSRLRECLTNEAKKVVSSDRN